MLQHRDTRKGDGRNKAGGQGEDRVFPFSGKIYRGQRIEERTLFDLEMMIEMGYCPGIEIIPGTSQEGLRANPSDLLDYFPRDCLVIIDESHITVAAERDVQRDRSRKETLVEYGSVSLRA